MTAPTRRHMRKRARAAAKTRQKRRLYSERYRDAMWRKFWRKRLRAREPLPPPPKDGYDIYCRHRLHTEGYCVEHSYELSQYNNDDGTCDCCHIQYSESPDDLNHVLVRVDEMPNGKYLTPERGGVRCPYAVVELRVCLECYRYFRSQWWDVRPYACGRDTWDIMDEICYGYKQTRHITRMREARKHITIDMFDCIRGPSLTLTYRLDEFKQNDRSALDLHGLSIRAISEKFGKYLYGTREIILSANYLKEIPASIFAPSNNINVVSLRNNNLEALPTEVAFHPKLRELDCSFNNIQQLPAGPYPNFQTCIDGCAPGATECLYGTPTMKSHENPIPEDAPRTIPELRKAHNQPRIKSSQKR